MTSTTAAMTLTRARFSAVTQPGDVVRNTPPSSTAWGEHDDADTDETEDRTDEVVAVGSEVVDNDCPGK
jgi:hypothetical protein